MECENCLRLVLRVSAMDETIAELRRGRDASSAWVKQGAKPKTRKARNSSTPRASKPAPITLSNRYDILSMKEFPLMQPVPVSSAPEPEPASVDLTSIRSELRSLDLEIKRLLECQRALGLRVAAFGTGGPPRPPVPEPPTDPSTTTLVVGSSMVRGVSLPGNAKTLCFPGARVQHLSQMLPLILEKHPNLRRIIIHVGTNDIMRRQSEVLKRSYTEMLDSLTTSGIGVTVSGPLPTHGRGDERWSRLRSFHLWLRNLCQATALDYVDNFELFNSRPSLFKKDGLHPNLGGTRLLSDNMVKCSPLIASLPLSTSFLSPSSLSSSHLSSLAPHALSFTSLMENQVKAGTRLVPHTPCATRPPPPKSPLPGPVIA